MSLKNIFDNINLDKNSEEFIEILKSDKIKIERIVSNGQVSPKDFWYEQEESEFVLLIDGEAILEFESREVKLQKGDFINIKAKEKHRVKYTSKEQTTIWLAIFY